MITRRAFAAPASLGDQVARNVHLGVERAARADELTPKAPDHKNVMATSTAMWIAECPPSLAIQYASFGLLDCFHVLGRIWIEAVVPS